MVPRHHCRWLARASAGGLVRPIPASWRVVDSQVVLKVGHVIDQLQNRDPAGEAATPSLRAESAENYEFSFLGFRVHKGVNHLLDLGLMRDQHLTGEA